MTHRIDPSLAGPPPSRPPPLLGSTESPVARAAPASSGAFLLEGERMAVSGSEMAGRHAFWLGGGAVAEGLEVRGWVAANVVTAPATLRRELVGRQGSLAETTLVTPSLPLAAVQWRRPPGAGGDVALDVGLTVLPGHRSVRYAVSDGSARFVADGGDAPAVEIQIHPPPAEWSVVGTPDGGLQVRVEVAAGEGPVTLAVAAGTERAARAALAAVPHLVAHETRAAAEWDPAALETLSTGSGVAEIDQAVAWATARVRGALARGADSDPSQAFWTGMGALAAGDAGGASRAVHALLRGADQGAVPWPGGGAAPAAVAGAFLAGRLTLLSGDPEPSLAALGRIPETLGAIEGPVEEAASAQAWRLALESLADALLHAASPEVVAGLRRRAAAPPPPTGRVRLPMAGPSAPALPAWAPWSLADPDAAWASWRSALAAGMAGGPWGPGSWDEDRPAGGGAARQRPQGAGGPPAAGAGAGVLLCRLAQGLLGLAPDAPSGRIRVAPAFPRHLTAFGAREIRVGDVRMTLAYRRDGELYRYDLVPTAGAVPAMVILAASVPSRAVDEARVDGAAAQLDVTARGGWSEVRVQLPLDGPRRVEVEGLTLAKEPQDA